MLHRVPVSFLETPTSPDRDERERLARLHFHLKTGDYFPTLATILGFLEETVGSCSTEPAALPPMERDLLRSVRKDLMHLHEHYRIEPKFGN